MRSCCRSYSALLSRCLTLPATRGRGSRGATGGLESYFVLDEQLREQAYWVDDGPRELCRARRVTLPDAVAVHEVRDAGCPCSVRAGEAMHEYCCDQPWSETSVGGQ
jgi:hypothetical protein